MEDESVDGIINSNVLHGVYSGAIVKLSKQPWLA